MNTEEKIQQLERQVAELLAWKAEKTRKQITYPLDKESKDLLVKEGFLKFLKTIYYTNITSQRFPSIITAYGNDNSLIAISNPIRQFSANASTDVCTSQNHGFANGDSVTLFNTNLTPDLPAPLITGATYTIRNVTTDTFKLEDPATVTIVDITDAGTGENFVAYAII